MKAKPPICTIWFPAHSRASQPGHPDQAYTDGSWGYIASDVGAYYNESGNAYNNGWYAYSGKDITYKFQLPAGTYELNAGFHEWWNVARYMDVSVDYVDAEGNPRPHWYWTTSLLTEAAIRIS